MIDFDENGFLKMTYENIVNMLSFHKSTLELNDDQIGYISDCLLNKTRKPITHFTCKAIMHGSEIFKEYCAIQCEHCRNESKPEHRQNLNLK